MTTRTTQVTVTFKKSFKLGEMKELFPPGSYEVIADEELLTGLSFTAYRRTATTIQIPSKTGKPHLARALVIDPSILEEAIKLDKNQDV